MSSSPPSQFPENSSPTDQSEPDRGFGTSHRSGNLFDGPAVSQMGAEVGFEVVSNDGVAPLRPSGVVCLILGLLSFSATIALPMVAIPVIAIAFGLYALRRHEGPKPVGTTAAIIGLMLASCAGAAGLAIPYFKQQSIGKQGAYFAKEFMSVIGDGNVNLALELKKHAKNRQLATMNLEKVYEEDDIAREERESAMEGAFTDLKVAGPGIEWELAERPRVYVNWGVNKVDTYWIDPSGKISQKVQVLMEWTPIESTGKGEWRVGLFQYYRERLVAESIL